MSCRVCLACHHQCVAGQATQTAMRFRLKKTSAGVPCLPLRVEGNLPAGEIRCRRSDAYRRSEPPLEAGGLARETKTGAALVAQNNTRFIVDPVGLEPTTTALQARRSPS